MRLAAGLCPDPLGELTALPRPPSRKRGLLLREGDGKERGKGGERRGRKGRGGKAGVEGRERGKGGEGRGGEGKERGKEGGPLD